MLRQILLHLAHAVLQLVDIMAVLCNAAAKLFVLRLVGFVNVLDLLLQARFGGPRHLSVLDKLPLDRCSSAARFYGDIRQAAVQRLGLAPQEFLTATFGVHPRLVGKPPCFLFDLVGRLISKSVFSF